MQVCVCVCVCQVEEMACVGESRTKKIQHETVFVYVCECVRQLEEMPCVGESRTKKIQHKTVFMYVCVCVCVYVWAGESVIVREAQTETGTEAEIRNLQTGTE